MMSLRDDPSPAYRRWRVAVLLAVLAGLLVLWQGAQVHRGEPRSGVRLSPPPEGSPQPAAAAAATQPAADDAGVGRFRVASFNIRSGRGTDERTDLARTARLLETFDVVGLNEVQGHAIRRRGAQNQSEALAGLLGMPWLFAATERQWWADDFGNGLLCGLPVEHWAILPLPGSRDSYRNVVQARVRLGEGAVLNVLVTHLDRTVDRDVQFQAVAAMFLSLAEPAMLIGDLNTRGGEPGMAMLLARAGIVDPIGDTPRLAAKERIDWILTRGLVPIDGGAVTTPASDHPMVWAELELPPSPMVERPNPAEPPLPPRPPTQPATAPAG